MKVLNKYKKNIFFILAIILAFVLIIGFVVSMGRVYRIKSVVYNCYDLDTFSEADIARMADVEMGQLIFTYNKERTRSNIESNSLLTVDIINIEFPDKVSITVTERKPAGLVPYHDDYILIDFDGNALRLADYDDYFNYPVIAGLQVKSFFIGSKLNTSSSYRLRGACNILKSLDIYDVTEIISEINVTDFNNFCMVSMGGVRIDVGQPFELNEKIKWLTAEQIVKLLEGRTEGILNIAVAEPVFEYKEEDVVPEE